MSESLCFSFLFITGSMNGFLGTILFIILCSVYNNVFLILSGDSITITSLDADFCKALAFDILCAFSNVLSGESIFLTLFGVIMKF